MTQSLVQLRLPAGRQEGIISDGDTAPDWAADNCSWVLAPPQPAAPAVQGVLLTVIRFALGPDDALRIDACSDAACADKVTSVSGSPFSAAAPPPQELAVAAVAVRVSFSSSWAQRARAGFALRYSAQLAMSVSSSTCLPFGMWHHVAAVLLPAGAGIGNFLAQIFINGSLAVTAAGSRLSVLALAGPLGLAVGRGSPDRPPVARSWSPTIGVWTAASPTGFWTGDVGDVRLWGRGLTAGEVAANMNRSCESLPGGGAGGSGDGPDACYPVNASKLTDTEAVAMESGGGSDACSVLRPVVGVRHSAWCSPAGDAASTEVGNTAVWGFCAAGPRLPGAGFDYDAAALDALAVLEPSTALGRLDGACWSVLVNFSSNRAGRFS